MIGIAKKLEKSGADFIIICTNTMHKISDDIQKNINIPILNIIDIVAKKIISKGLIKIGLLGTIFTMEQDFYKGRLVDNYNLEVVVPSKKDRNIINNIIFNELSAGVIDESSKKKCIDMV